MIVLKYVWLFWFYFTRCLNPVLLISDWILQIVSLTLDNRLILASVSHNVQNKYNDA